MHRGELILASSAPFAGAGDGNRTHVASLEGWSSTIELHPRNTGRIYILPEILWSGRRDSNSRHSPWQGDALPLSHSRRCFGVLSSARDLLYITTHQMSTPFFKKICRFPVLPITTAKIRINFFRNPKMLKEHS